MLAVLVCLVVTLSVMVEVTVLGWRVYVAVVVAQEVVVLGCRVAVTVAVTWRIRVFVFAAGTSLLKILGLKLELPHMLQMIRTLSTITHRRPKKPRNEPSGSDSSLTQGKTRHWMCASFLRWTSTLPLLRTNSKGCSGVGVILGNTIFCVMAGTTAGRVGSRAFGSSGVVGLIILTVEHKAFCWRR